MNTKLMALFLGALAVLPMAALAVPNNIVKGNGKANGKAGKSTVEHLYLVEKNPTAWTIVEDGAWGKLQFNTKNEKFVFNGHKLEPKTEFTLIYYPDPWPGNGLICLGSDTSDKKGNVNIKGKFDWESIPFSTEENAAEGAKIWLVLSSDVDCDAGISNKMSLWNPTEYLFEYNLINKP